ncbi:hypothetical protein BJ742DRAFT_814376 [Cladochytrium replicatum]|nr:hypothetical protein BJ742DRAFT_814376 [Cladochytrium replicatum]
MIEVLDEQIWSDLEPIVQDDGPHPIVPIGYAPEYRLAMDRMRAVMHANEMSERALKLTTFILGANSSHYTIWHYRQKLLVSLKVDLHDELEFITEMANENPKSYQTWHHRQEIVQLLGDSTGELDFIESALDQDSKNYHCWQYRQWLVRYFKLWESELQSVSNWILRDVRNNSAWNQRYFYFAARAQPDGMVQISPEELSSEVRYSVEKILIAPNNPSPYNYLRGIVKLGGKSLADFSEILRLVEELNAVPSALAIRLDLYESILESGRDSSNPTESVRNKAHQTCELLEEHDPIRRKLWSFRKLQLEL